MDSRKPFKKSDGSDKQKHYDKNKSQKQNYQKKNYKSSPNVSSSATEKIVLFQCQASSKSMRTSNDDLSLNSFTKSVKNKSRINEEPHTNSVARHNELHPAFPMQRTGGLHKDMKNKNPPPGQKLSNVSHFESPLFMSETSRAQPQTNQHFKPKDPSEKNRCNNFSKNEGAQFSAFKNHKPGSNFKNPDFQQNACHRGRGNGRFNHGNARQDNYAVNATNPFRSNQPAVVTAKQIPVQFHENRQFDASSKYQTPGGNFKNPNMCPNPRGRGRGNAGVCRENVPHSTFATNLMTSPLINNPSTLGAVPKMPPQFPKKVKFNAKIYDPSCQNPDSKKPFFPQKKNQKKKSEMKSFSSNYKKKGKAHYLYSQQRRYIKGDTSKIGEQETSCNVEPLLSIQCGNVASQENDLIQFSDEDDEGSIASDYSVNSNINLIDFSNDMTQVCQTTIEPLSSLIDLSDVSVVDNEHLANTDSDSTDETGETDETSEVSSSVFSSESRINVFSPGTTKEAYVSVFWDIENCALPSKKSAVEFANYVRNTFYEGRTELQFTAACDVSKLSSILNREIYEANITLIHINAINKNAADKQIQSLLQRFQIQYRKTNSAVVLISSDSDFSQSLIDMRYQHHIFVNLVCKRETRDSLKTAANKYVYFDDIMEKLGDRAAKNDAQHTLVIENLPKMSFKLIKSSLSEKLSSFNCRVNVNMTCAKVVFQDYSVCNKAINALKGFYLGGNALKISYHKDLKELESSEKRKKKEEKLQSLNTNIKESAAIPKNMTNVPLDQDLMASHGASLSIVVGSYLGSVEHWKNFFENEWKTSDFSIRWEGSILDGFILVDFKSLKKAQKIKKMLMKNQMKDPNAPKFLKLIKYGEDFGNLRESLCTIDPKKKKIEETISIIEKKKSKLLMKHESMMSEEKNARVPEMHEVSEATLDKLKECQEQMKTFKSFCANTVNIVNTLYNSQDIESKLKEILCDFTRECNCFSLALPIYAKKDIILKAVRNNQVTIIKAETGSGKSTQLTQYIWRDKIKCKDGMIICTQPRKIAAISLAKYVSTQVGSKLGDIVGYKIGMSSKLSANTKILYVTDFTMLKMLISEDLNSFSCIIIDEAHERTIYTDILIAMIKQHLPSYPHLKIVITSATIDTSIFRNYFVLADNSVLHVSGRTFPIEDMWLDFDITPEWDYFSATVNIALEILKEGPGNVLLFLTTPLETEKACDLFSQKLKGRRDANKIKTFYLHGKMNSEEQQKIFEKTGDDIRKVIFATNCAETSITIPGVKYVVDCGLVKECQYDAARNMNVLAVGLVSKSSAEQRRGRAGRTQPGKCFRLYSKNNYDKMVSSTDPEILRINLGQALLKLLKMGIKNPHQFDFLQSPPREQLTYAMNQLIHLKAIEENTYILTELGNKMAVLPLEPRLCHLIFQGFDCNIGYDSLVVAALVTMSHALFFRNSENKDEADRKKRRFCDSESDYITYLDVYKEWVDVPKNSKSQWCVINCVNARSMRIVQELVNEIILILQKELQIKVNVKFNSDSSDALMKIIFNSFSQNLSVYSGHPKFGYRCLNMPDHLSIHPSSSLYSFEQITPQFVVYETILKTSRTFMMNISPVTKDMILEAKQSNRLATDLKAFDDLMGTELCINNLGEKIILNNFVGKKGMKRREIQNMLKETTGSESIEIDVDVPKGCVKIFCFDNTEEEIKSLVTPIVNNARNFLIKEVKDVDLYGNGSLTAIMKAGGVIEDVVLPGEFRDLKIFLKEQGDIDSVLEKLSSCGDIIGTREWKRYFKVSFQTPASAKRALDTFNNENDFFLQKMIKYSNAGCDMYKIHMTFIRRPCEGIAYITLDPPLSFQLPPFVQYNDTLVSLSISKKTGDIRVLKLPLNADQNTLRTVASSLLPPDVKIKKCIITRKKSYESTKEELDMTKDKILSLFAEFTFKENIEVYLKEPRAADFIWSATICIKNSHDGETAVNVLKSRKHITGFLGGFTLKPNLQTFLYCKSEIFSVVKEEILTSIEDFKKIQPSGNELSLDVIPKGTNVEIKIMSNNVSDVTTVRSLLYGIISGDTLNFFHNSSKEKFFSHTGKEFMNELTKMYQDCLIYQNNYKKTVTIFGKESSINMIKTSINNFLTSLELEDCKDISLITDNGKSIFKELLKMYGYDLLKLKEECSISNIKFNKFKQVLTIQGNSPSVLKFESIVQDLKKTIESLNIKENGEVCPVCCDEILEDKHCLEYCGHFYCSECLLHLFQSSEDIPLKCEFCGDPIVLEDIFWAVNKKKPLEKALFEKFLISFVSGRKDIRFCPSSDCNMIFRVTEEANIFKCPLCGNSICTHCEELYHFGMSCSLNKCMKSDSDYSLKAWMQENPENRKLCPSCKSPIEKNGGCNHMTCWKCKSHMCWLCLKVYPTGNEVYDHQKYCPMSPRS